MPSLDILSWNVNGIRAVDRKGALDWFFKESPDILCIQETKARPDQLPGRLVDLEGHTSHFVSAQKKGYSGVAIYTRPEPEVVFGGIGIDRFDSEGRTIIARYPWFDLYSVYFPNGKAREERLRYKMDFYDALLDHSEKARKEGRSVIIVGDVNTAHREIDLARPKENSTVSGFLPEERAWIDRFLETGYVDSLRVFDDGPENYSWWDYKTKARERNVGWRIDYIFVSEDLRDSLESATIRTDVFGSDHCPVGIRIRVD